MPPRYQPPAPRSRPASPTAAAPELLPAPQPPPVARPDDPLPTPVDALLAPQTSLGLVTPRLAKLLAKVSRGERIVDLLLTLPFGVVQRRLLHRLSDAKTGEMVIVTVRIETHQRPRGPGRPWRVLATDGESPLEIILFNVKGDWPLRTYPAGEERLLVGRISEHGVGRRMAHPDQVLAPDRLTELPPALPVRHLTQGLEAQTLERLVEEALALVHPSVPEWLDPALAAREAWPGWRAALESVHHPDHESALGAKAPGRRRLAYDELLADQVALQAVRVKHRRTKAEPLGGDGRLRAELARSLPWPLTTAQQQAISEIEADLAEPQPMLRLLQGDVGAGKTIVALFAMLAAVESGRQAALMAPTEILAQQHAQTLAPFAAKLGLKLGLITGSDGAAQRRATRMRLADGSLPLVVGTHALIQEGVHFRSLALAVIDEQHRFGVRDRLALAGKGEGVHVLVMTATPIPRTLTLADFGDLDISRLTGKPPGRQPVETRIVSQDRLEEVAARLKSALARGARAYWICPLVEESHVMDLAAARERAAWLTGVLGPGRVSLLHGQMKPADKQAAMADFATGRTQLLVSTTVVEVGVNVPEATIMVIDHAERFGLSQLHQLRGRVGRSEAASVCLLLYAPPLSPGAEERLKTLRETEDGFQIAEADLRLRGAGELMGTRQSGLPTYRIARLPDDEDLLAIAHQDARALLSRDPRLATPRGQAVRLLLRLFARPEAEALLRSG